MIDLFVFIFLIGFISILIAKNVANVLPLTIALFSLDQWGQIAHPMFIRYSFLTNLIVGVLVLLAFIKEFLSGKIFLKNIAQHKVMLLTMFLILFSISSSLWSPVSDLAFEKWMDQIPYFIVIIFMTPLLVCRHSSFEESLPNVQIFGLMMVVVFAFLVDWHMRSIVAKSGQVTIALPLALAQLGGLVFLFSAFYVKSKNIFWLMVRVLAALISMILIFKTGSRGQAIAVLISVSVFAPLLFKRKNFKAIFAIIFITAVVFVLAYFAYTTYAIQDTRWSEGELVEDVTGRMSMAVHLLNYYGNSGPFTWIFGLGSSASFDDEILGFYSHVIPVEILGEQGLIGFILFLLIVVLTIKNIVRIIRLVDYLNLKRNVLVVLSSSALFLFIVSFKSGALVGAYYLFLFPVLLERYLVYLSYRAKYMNR